MDSQAQYTSTHHVRETIRNGGAQAVGRLPANQVMQLDIVLQLRDPEGLRSFLDALYDPNSGIYHQYLTPQEFTERFGPSQQDYDDVVGFAKTNGLEVVGGSRDGMEVQVRGPVSAVEAAFHVTMRT
jgi:subtilase family serine protease